MCWIASIIWPWRPISRPRSSPSRSARTSSASSSTWMLASMPHPTRICSSNSSTREPASPISAFTIYLLRPERFFFLRGGGGGVPPLPLPLRPLLAATGSGSRLGRPRISPEMPPPLPSDLPFGPESSGGGDEPPPPVSPLVPPPRPPPGPSPGGPAPAVATSGGGVPISLRTVYCWPIVHRFVVIQ